MFQTFDQKNFKILISRRFEIFTKNYHLKLVGTPCNWYIIESKIQVYNWILARKFKLDDMPDCVQIPNFWTKIWLMTKCVPRTSEDLGGPWRTLADLGEPWGTSAELAGPWRTLVDRGGPRRTPADPGGPRRTPADPGGPRRTSHHTY